MKVKTIKFKIKKKIDAWLESITDKELRADLEVSTIVTGGAIASMLRGEEVNDYDLYFINKSIVIRLIKYYRNWALAASITILDGAYKQDYINEAALTKEKFIPSGSAYNMAIANLDEDRVTMFFDGRVGYEVKVPMEIHSDKTTSPIQREKFSPLFFSANAITLTDDIQIITRFHGGPLKIHKNFDFVHATNYYKVKTNELYLNKKALISLMTSELKYMGGSKYPLTAMIRTRKFQARGYTIGAGEMVKIMFQLNEYNLKDPVVLSEQLIGVDIAYFNDLIDALIKAKKDPEFSITNTWIMQKIDEIFDKIEHNED